MLLGLHIVLKYGKQRIHVNEEFIYIKSIFGICKMAENNNNGKDNKDDQDNDGEANKEPFPLKVVREQRASGCSSNEHLC